ncbi:MAG TPA: alpha/beta fold hydrolase [Gaiellales bacterium]|nr:alpha/beta fold hydrolase [Gaiellales bacterium]
MNGPGGIHAETAGEGPALVLVHAGICDSGMWDPQWRTLAGRHHLIRHDMRGFGRSPVPPVPHSHARDLVAVMDAAGVAEAVVVGTSMGGRVALEVAVAHPERVSALVLVGSGLPGHEWSDAVQEYWAAEDQAIGRGDLAAAAEVNVRFWIDGPGRRPEDVDPELRRHAHAMQLRALELQVPSYLEVGDLEEMLVPDLGERLGEVTQPTLVVIGEADQPDIHAIARRIVANLPETTEASIPDAAHLPSMERPEVFDRLLEEFLSRRA